MGNLKNDKNLNGGIATNISINQAKGSKSNSNAPSNKSSKDSGKSSKSNVSKQKVVLPTLRETQRYLVYKLIFNDNLNGNSVIITDFEKIHNDIIAQSNSLLGIFDGASAGLMSAKYDLKTLSGIIRVDSKSVDKLKICLGMIKNSYGKNLTINPVFVSGVINKAIDKMNSI